MSNQAHALTNAIIFFVIWLLILLAGADFPPPPGFVWIVITVAICAAIVYWRVPTYLSWYHARRPGRTRRVLLDGFVAGLLVAIPFAIKGSGEPSVTMNPVAFFIWFAVLAIMGMLNSTALYLINTLAIRISSRMSANRTKRPMGIEPEDDTGND